MTVALAVVAAIAVLIAAVALREHRGSRLLVSSRAQIEQLHAQVQQLEAQNEQLRTQVQQLEVQNEQLHAQVEAADDGGARRRTTSGLEVSPLAVADGRGMTPEPAGGAGQEEEPAGGVGQGEEGGTDRPRRPPEADVLVEMVSARSSAQAGVIWQLEQMRLQREWRDVAGAAAPAPVAWDDPVAAALAVELELIRESIGTPGHLEIVDIAEQLQGGGGDGTDPEGMGADARETHGAAETASGDKAEAALVDEARTQQEAPGRTAPAPTAADGSSVAHCVTTAHATDPTGAVSTVRLVGELLRCLARIGEELVVRLGRLGIEVTVAVEAGTDIPDVTGLSRLATAAGGSIEVIALHEALQVQVSMPPGSR